MYITPLMIKVHLMHNMRRQGPEVRLLDRCVGSARTRAVYGAADVSAHSADEEAGGWGEL